MGKPVEMTLYDSVLAELAECPEHADRIKVGTDYKQAGIRTSRRNDVRPQESERRGGAEARGEEARSRTGEDERRNKMRRRGGVSSWGLDATTQRRDATT